MALYLTGNPYLDARAKEAELQRQRRISVENVPGVQGGVYSEAPIPGTLSLRNGTAYFSGHERAVASMTAPLRALLDSRGGTLDVTLTPMGNITGQAVDHNAYIMEMGRMAYRVAVR